MIRKVSWLALGAMLFALCSFAEAQQTSKVYRIGYVSPGSPARQLNAFREGLRQLGYLEGKNIAIEYRHAGNRADGIATLVDELVRFKPDVLIATSTETARAAQRLPRPFP